MALTTEDLNQFTDIVEGTVKGIVSRAVAPLATKAELDAKLDAKLSAAVSGLATKADLDRMEARITTSMGLLERDTFSRLDQHEARITRLEQARP